MALDEAIAYALEAVPAVLEGRPPEAGELEP
jgi:hypothetical protein